MGILISAQANRDTRILDDSSFDINSNIESSLGESISNGETESVDSFLKVSRIREKFEPQEPIQSSPVDPNKLMTSSQIGKIDRFRISDLNDRLDLGRFNPHAPSCGGVGALRKSLPSITSSSIDQIEIPLDQSGSRNTAGSSGLLQTIFNQTRTNQKPVSTGSSDSDQTKPRKT